jgi:CubicO group peptidase (beta-lactamase class C family)
MIRIAWASVVLAFATSFGVAFADAPPPSSSPMPAADPIAAAADAVAAKLIAGKHVPGAAIGVSRGGTVVFERGYGYADVAKRIPVTVDTRFEIGSVTKQFTAACIMQLVEAGKLSLDDHLGTFVSDYFIGRGVTVRQLLAQQSGIPEYLEGPDAVTAAGSQPATYATLLARVSATPLEFAPGTRYKYSNTNYILLGRIVEVASGEPYERYVREHIFAPAGMTQSAFISDESSIPPMAKAYAATPSGFEPAPPLRDDWATSAGAIVSTVGDMLKWDAALLGGKIVKPADVALMRTDAKTVDGTATGYAFGWLVDAVGGHPRIWHNGATFGFHAVNETFPTEGEAIVVLVNSTVFVEGEIAPIFAATHPDAAPPTTAAAGELPAVTARVRDWLRRFETGDIDRSQLNDTMNKALNQDLIDASKAQLGPLGTPESLVYRGKVDADGSTVYVYVATFSQGTFRILMSLDATGKISGYRLVPA